MKNSILVVGFEPENRISYPHHKAVLDMLSAEADVGYFHFRERGYFLADYFKISLPNLLKLRLLRILLQIGIDYYKLRKKAGSYGCILAIDNFTYALANRCHGNVVLWSNDFVSADQQSSKTFIQRLVNKHCRRGLEKNPRLIIQDADRAQEFCKSIGINIQLDKYMLPVSLPKLPSFVLEYLDKKLMVSTPPVVMQMGGINIHRSSSDKIIKNYQQHSSDYTLCLHGYFAGDIKQLLQQVKILPFCSTLEAEADALSRLVAACDIGLVSYNCQDRNFYFIAHASGQLAEFLRCGKPVIVMGDTNLKEMVEKTGVGLYVQDVDKLSDAIRCITNDYDKFVLRCKKVYQDEYCLDAHKNLLTGWLFGQTLRK